MKYVIEANVMDLRPNLRFFKAFLKVLKQVANISAG